MWLLFPFRRSFCREPPETAAKSLPGKMLRELGVALGVLPCVELRFNCPLTLPEDDSGGVKFRFDQPICFAKASCIRAHPLVDGAVLGLPEDEFCLLK